MKLQSDKAQSMSQVEQVILVTQHGLQRKTDLESMKAEMEILKMKPDDLEDEDLEIWLAMKESVRSKYRNRN